jgi:hypothetical protein
VQSEEKHNMTMKSMKDERGLRDREDYSMSRVVVPLKNTDMMCIVNKNIYNDGEYEGLS